MPATAYFRSLLSRWLDEVGLRAIEAAVGRSRLLDCLGAWSTFF
jgi:hypothetical protein